MGSSWGQEPPFPREARNNSASSEQGQTGLGLEPVSEQLLGAGRVSRCWPVGQGSCQERAGPEWLFLKRNFPSAPREIPSMGEWHRNSCWGGGSGAGEGPRLLAEGV